MSINEETRLIPEYLSQRLRQTLGVIYRIYRKGYPRVLATQEVAELFKRKYTTIEDKYTRQHGIVSDVFDEYMKEPGLIGLKKIILLYNQNYHAEIHSFFKEITKEPPAPARIKAQFRYESLSREEIMELLQTLQKIQESENDHKES